MYFLVGHGKKMFQRLEMTHSKYGRQVWMNENKKIDSYKQNLQHSCIPST